MQLGWDDMGGVDNVYTYTFNLHLTLFVKSHVKRLEGRRRCASGARDCFGRGKRNAGERAVARWRRRTEQLEVRDAGLHLLADRTVVPETVVVGLNGDEESREGDCRQHERGAKPGQNAPAVRVWTEDSAECGKHRSVLYQIFGPAKRTT